MYYLHWFLENNCNLPTTSPPPSPARGSPHRWGNNSASWPSGRVANRASASLIYASGLSLLRFAE